MTARPRSTLEWLECSACRRALRPDGPRNLCPCGGVLLARYRLEEAARTLRPEALKDRAPGLWRYAEVLPGSENPLSLGEGGTPLHRASFLERSLGVGELWIKDESLNPTGSFKARGMAAAVTMARGLGLKRLALPSAGNAAGAAAAYAALAGLALEAFLPEDTPEPFLLETRAYGAGLHLLPGSIADCGIRVREGAERGEWFDLSTLREPYRLEGKKTMGYELVEQMEGDLPDWIVYPTGGGTGLIGMWKAFEEMEHLGWIPRGRRPRMVVVQAEGCAPIVRAFEAGRRRAAAWENPRTAASGLRVPSPLGDALILDVLRESRGRAVAVTDAAMGDAQLEIARGEGIFSSPEGGATLAALRRLVEEGVVSEGDRVVLFATGTGLKYPDALPDGSREARRP